MVVIDQLLSKDEVAHFCESLKKAQWDDGTKTAMGMAASVKRNHQASPEDPLVQQLANTLLSKIGAAPGIISAALPQRIFPPCFNRYEQSETYGYHVDAAIMRLPKSQEVLRSDVSMTIFLSEPEHYDGGELIIATEFGEQSIKLPAGHAVVYPSSSLHKVTAVTKGQRLAAITWMQSMIASAELRQNLYELDRCIQSFVAQQNADREQLDQLHHVYHNLIRQNASV